MQYYSSNPGADRDKAHPLVRTNPRRIGADNVDQQHALVQDTIVTQVMRQGERDAGACRGEDRSRSRQANWGVCQDPADELVFPLAQSRALLFEEQIPRSPR